MENKASEQDFYKRRAEIEKISGCTLVTLKYPEILGHNLGKGWVHICYLADLPDYLSLQHYNTPGHLRNK